MASIKLNSKRHESKTEKIKRSNVLDQIKKGDKSGLKPDKSLDKFTTMLFYAIVNNNDQLTTADNSLVNLLCHEYMTYRNAQNNLNKHGYITKDGKKSPYYSISKQTVDEIVKLSSKLKLTPEDRINTDFHKQDDTDPVARALGRGEND